MNFKTKILLLLLLNSSISLVADEIEEIKVTGSYIGSRSNEIGTEVIDQSDFNNLNITTVGEISKYLASAAGAHLQ